MDGLQQLPSEHLAPQATSWVLNETRKKRQKWDKEKEAKTERQGSVFLHKWLSCDNSLRGSTVTSILSYIISSNGPWWTQWHPQNRELQGLGPSRTPKVPHDSQDYIIHCETPCPEGGSEHPHLNPRVYNLWGFCTTSARIQRRTRNFTGPLLSKALQPQFGRSVATILTNKLCSDLVSLSQFFSVLLHLL